METNEPAVAACLKQIEKRKLTQAIETLSTAIQDTPMQSLLYIDRGTVYAKSGKLKEAEYDFIKASEVDPTNFIPYYNLFNLTLKAKDYSEAFNYICCSMSLLYTKRGIRDNSPQDFQQAIQLSQNNIEAQLALASIYFENKKYQNALKRLNKTIQMHRSSALLYKIRALIHRQLKSNQSYKQDLQTAKKLSGTPNQLPKTERLESTRTIVNETISKDKVNVIKQKYRQYTNLLQDLGISTSIQPPIRGMILVKDQPHLSVTWPLIQQAEKLECETAAFSPRTSAKSESLYPIKGGQKVELTLLKANLTNDKELFGKMDPYCKIFYHQYLHDSNVVKAGGTSPVWNQSFILQLPDSPSKMKVKVYDRQNYGLQDDFVGQGSTEISKQGQVIVTIYEGSKQAGKVYFNLKRV